nr:hypothetical protein [Tanacetum cinerariifolium]
MVVVGEGNILYKIGHGIIGHDLLESMTSDMSNVTEYIDHAKVTVHGDVDNENMQAGSLSHAHLNKEGLGSDTTNVGSSNGCHAHIPTQMTGSYSNS